METASATTRLTLHGSGLPDGTSSARRASALLTELQDLILAALAALPPGAGTSTERITERLFGPGGQGFAPVVGEMLLLMKGLGLASFASGLGWCLAQAPAALEGA